MKKIFVALCMVAFLAACDDSSSASAENNEPTTLSSAEEQGSSSSTKKLTDSSDSRCEECNDEAISSSGNAESSSSEKLSESSSSSAGKAKSSSSVVTLAMPCKTETEDNCEYGELTDDRDGQTYKTVKIGAQWWMAENLNFDPGQGGSGEDKYDWSWCYNDEPANCDVTGRFYTWAAAIDSVKLANDVDNPQDCGYGRECGLTGKVQGICPSGWHLPSNEEWNALFTAVGGQSNAGKVLKSQTGWYSNGNGTDAFGFSALPAGYRDDDGYFDGDGVSAFFWSEYDSINAYDMGLYFSNEYAFLDYDVKYYGFSVRCLRD